ncbi:hypothetical protein FOVSG1_003798 [Fusarium oxysporum f. sp. vasinfectum]
MFAHLHMQIDCSLTLTHSLLQNPRDGKKQLHLDICCIVKALSSSFSLLPPSSFTPKTLIYHSSSNVITISTSN